MSIPKPTSNTLALHARDERDTVALGRALARLLPDGAVVALCGTLGSGKTRLVQALAEAAGVDPAVVVSPTFVLVHEYQGDRPIHHFDAYRLDDEDQFLALGPEEYFERPGISLVEWADRVRRCLPEQHLEVAIDVTGPTERRFELTGHGAAYREVVEQLERELAGKLGGPARGLAAEQP